MQNRHVNARQRDAENMLQICTLWLLLCFAVHAHAFSPTQRIWPAGAVHQRIAHASRGTSTNGSTKVHGPNG